MAAYPSLPQSPESSWDIIDNVISGRSADGTLRSRVMTAEEKHVFVIVHELTASELTTLRTFYTNNRTAESFDLTWAGDGAVYACQFTGAIRIKPIDRSGRWHVSVPMEEV